MTDATAPPRQHLPEQNYLLAALSPEERERVFPHLRLVSMRLGKVLYESGDALEYVYFPTDSIVSLLYVLESGASAEISVVGHEGLIGIALFMGGGTTPSRAIVQSAGHAYRLAGQKLKDEFHRNGGLQLLLLRYTQALITQMAQTAVCNRHHSVDQQLCRWLLLSLDRLQIQQAGHDPGAHRQHARRPPRRRHGCGRQAAENRRHQLQPRTDHRARPAAARAAVLRVLFCRQARNGSHRRHGLEPRRLTTRLLTRQALLRRSSPHRDLDEQVSRCSIQP